MGGGRERVLRVLGQRRAFPCVRSCSLCLFGGEGRARRGVRGCRGAGGEGGDRVGPEKDRGVRRQEGLNTHLLRGARGSERLHRGDGPHGRRGTGHVCRPLHRRHPRKLYGKGVVVFNGCSAAQGLSRAKRCRVNNVECGGNVGTVTYFKVDVRQLRDLLPAPTSWRVTRRARRRKRRRPPPIHLVGRGFFYL